MSENLRADFDAMPAEFDASTSAITRPHELMEAYTSRCAGRTASLGDFVPQTLAFLGKPPQSQLWAVARLRSRSANPAHTSEQPMSPRESFALARILLGLALAATLSQARAFLRARFQSRFGRGRRQDPLQA